MENNIYLISTDINIKSSISNEFIEKNITFETKDNYTTIFPDICSSKEFLEKKCNNEDESLKAKENIINQIKNDIINGNIKELLKNITNEEKKDIIIEGNKVKYQITSSYNQINKKYNNISTIKLGECENILKNHYNISKSETLIIFKIDIYEEGLLMPIIEYEVYHPVTLAKLDLEICFDEKIEITVPIKINENEIYKHDPSSDYYNDKCFPSDNENGTDIILSDRKNEYIDKNLTLCENNCEFNGIDNETKQAICQCEIKNEINIKSDVIIDKEKLLTKFSDIKSLINIDIMKCYKLLLTKDGLIKNIGSYILLSTIIIYIISLYIFSRKGFYFFNMQIKEIENIKELYLNSNRNNNIQNIRNINFRKTQKIKKKPKKKQKNKKKTKTYKANPPKRNINRNNLGNRNIIINKYDSFRNSNRPSSKTYLSNEKMNIKYNKNKILNLKKNNDEYANNNKLIINFNNYELNSLSYSDALKYDKRTYCEYYFSLLKTKHLLLFSFYPIKDYNSPIIKIFLFFFTFVLFYTVNALFYTDSTMHEIYEESGKFNFIYHIPQILYSTIISSSINIIIKTLSLSEKNILEIKKEKKIIDLKNKIKKVLKCLKIKFTFFFILSFIFLVLFWYYLSCFCAVYKNTQIHLLKDTLLSFCLSLLYPFGLNLIPGFFRIPSLKDVNKNKICLYRISKIIQII